MFNSFFKKSQNLEQSTRTTKKEPHFFIFANRDSYKDDLDHFLMNHKDIDNSIFVFFNNGEPFKHSVIAQNHENKWIFFRSLKKGHNQLAFRDLSLLEQYNFTKIFTIPDVLTEQMLSKEITKDFLLFIDEHNIDPKTISHIGSTKRQSQTYHDLNQRINRRKKPYHDNKFLSSGTWIYIYIRQNYPNSKITLLGFNSKIDSVVHDPGVERQFLIFESVQRRCEMFDFL